ncbi:hypothetical protein K0U91_01220 [Chryseobacterium chendengshani]|uniref:P-loop NTPase n=1 Tax=Chryseobacterium sp. LJ668 TaxID=2864040 RepID=UPI001C68BC50|nr:hypothetical protein [Chryseobacterium sp. LJ668]MBW8523845.1 hypothetical protein [Chryseobacterium sp. LJ668]QYK16788.1 hypothetical protein K0U91_01220 [Chryseobacterium sp. LJ668]
MKTQYNLPTLNKITEELDNLIVKRTGGAINFRGMHFQILYSSYLILKELDQNSDEKSIRMEGIEDIDLSTSQNILIDNEYIQVKSSINKMDAGSFWNLGVLQNFAETYMINPESQFKLVYNMEISKGNLHDLIHNRDISEFWITKLQTLNKNIIYEDFLLRISYEHKTSNDLFNEILVLLFKNWQINKGTEFQFLRSLFYNVFIWSQNRSTVTNNDINILFQDIKDSYSKAAVNSAVQNNWISKVSYAIMGNYSSHDFYDGKAARPVHIGLGLPVQRRIWQKTIYESLINADVTVIKSSSGQGKSTLAWQTGLNLQEKNNYTIYELRNCANVNEADSVAEFLLTRVIIGEKPLLVIDGLNSLVESWFEIVTRTRDYPVKYLLTARQEDWYRFGADLSQVKLMIVDISLSMSEAGAIFEEFKRKQKIHLDISKWQPVWEQVRQKGLLIEYTYLLTRGEMIQERLSAQLKYLSNSKSSGAKLEMLRMISLADCLNIRLKTINLINYIKAEIGFDQDRGELLNELEKEYFLNFGGDFVEGLHPVRSQHLNDLLHKNLPIEDSLRNLFKIITDEYKQHFFSNIPILVTEQNKASLYNTLADAISEDSFDNIVLALDGIMHAEPKRYWDENKLKFDEAYKSGGIDLFAITSTPFTELNTLTDMAEILGDQGGNFRNLATLKDELSNFQFENSDVIIFAKALNSNLQKRLLSIDSYKGLGFLIKWYNSLQLPLSLPLIKPEIDELTKMDFQEAKEFMLFFQLSNPLPYKDFIEENIDKIKSYLKVNTDSLNIEEKDNEIHIEYLLEDKNAKLANNLSVSKIDDIHCFLPFYKKYCTEALMLPFPSEEMISMVKQDSIKRLSPEIIGNSFEIHLNQIWNSEISKIYQESSSYHWQEKILGIRKVALEWSKSITRIIDALLEGNEKKKKTYIEELDRNRTLLNNSIISRKKYPRFDNYSEQEIVVIDEKEINLWISSLININNQIYKIFIPDVEHERNLALINFKSIYFNLQNMQNAFRVIEKKSVAYFDSENICAEENKHYDRLYATILYYLSQIPLENKTVVSVGRKAVEEWWLHAKSATIDDLNLSLKIIERTSDYKFVYPEKITETPTLTYLTVGILDFDFSDTTNFQHLLFNLGLLRDIHYDFITIINVKDNIALNGFRLKKDLINVLDNLIDGTEDIDMTYLAPLPIAVDEETIKNLPGIYLSEKSINNDLDKKFEILIDLWKLSECRNYLNIDSAIEMAWLKKLQLDSKIKSKLSTIKAPSNRFSDFVLNGLEPNCIYSKEDITVEIYEQIAIHSVSSENKDI